jgi:hypothetical protein
LPGAAVPHHESGHSRSAIRRRGVLRLWDPESDHLRAIGLDLLGFSEPQWSPDGSSLASLTSAKSLIVFDPGGAWRLRVETTWEDQLARGS